MSTKIEHAASTSTPKISKFAAKSGFVIPKNKLSGSLVPIFRGTKKRDAASEENSKQAQRKTKWGPDVSRDTAVRKGKALAYQTRVDQITEQLNSGFMDIEDDPSQISGSESSGHVLNGEKSELLKVEKREAIGEILILNPSYKAPADYKPVLREAKVPIPIKDYPGYNFISQVFGPASDTQKRLEKETGAKIRVFGTRSDKGMKEVTANEIDTQILYDELYVYITADTYEKVDVAVPLIELLVKPIAVNPIAAASSDNMNVISTSQGNPVPYSAPPPLVNQGGAQPIIGSGQAQAQLPGQFQPYSGGPGPWFPSSSPSGFVNPQNSSAPIPSNPVQVFGQRPTMAAGFGSVPQNPSFIPSRPQPILQHPYMPRAPPSYSGPPRNPPMSAPGQPTPTGPPQVIGPLMPQSTGPATFPVRSTGWSQAPTGQSNMGQIMLPALASSSPIVMSGAPSSTMVSPIPSPFPPSTFRSSGPTFTPLPPPYPHSGVQNFGSGGTPPSATPAPKPLLPSSNDFTFQPHRPQNPAPPQMGHRPSIQPAPQSIPPHNLNLTVGLPQTPQISSFLPPGQNSTPAQGFSRPQVSGQMSQPRSQMPLPSAGNPRHPTFTNPGPPSPATPVHQMGMRNGGPGPQGMNAAGAFPFRPGNPMQQRQNYSQMGNRPHQGLLRPNQPFNGSLPFHSGKPAAPNSFGGPQQNYDPFSPTIPLRPQLCANPSMLRKQESDPEYEDLMASVGLK